MPKSARIKEIAKDYFHIGVNISKDKEQVKEDIVRYGAGGHYDIMMKDLWVRMMSEASSFIQDNSTMKEIDRNGNGTVDYRASMFILTEDQMLELYDIITELEEEKAALIQESDKMYMSGQGYEEDVDILEDKIKDLESIIEREEEEFRAMELKAMDLEEEIIYLEEKIEELKNCEN